MLTPQHRSARHARFPRAVTTLGLALTLGLGLGIGPATAAQSDRAPASGTASGTTPVAVAALTSTAAAAPGYKIEIQAADASLAAAVANLRAGRYVKAMAKLTGVRRHTENANIAAQVLVGRPPADPESDDPPGPPAVIAVTRLDNRITKGAVALFNRRTNLNRVLSLRRTVGVAQQRRDLVLNKVIALPAGKADDYADSMSDTLGIYSTEVKYITNALATFTLSSSGRTGLTNALARARATNAKVNRVWGGGERPAS